MKYGCRDTYILGYDTTVNTSNAAKNICNVLIYRGIWILIRFEVSQIQKERLGGRMEFRVEPEEHEFRQEAGLEDIIENDDMIQDDPVIQFTRLDIAPEQAFDVCEALEVFRKLFVFAIEGMVIVGESYLLPRPLCQAKLASLHSHRRHHIHNDMWFVQGIRQRSHAGLS